MIRLMKAKDIYAPAHIRELVFHALSRMRKDREPSRFRRLRSSDMPGE